MQTKYKVLLVITFITLSFILPNNISARQIPRHPNGTLVKAINNPKVYYIDNNTKRPIESPNIFTNQFRWQDIVTVSPVELDAIPTGVFMTFKEGSLLSNRGVIYIVSDGLRRPIDSFETFLQKGYKLNNVISVTDRDLSVHPQGAVLTTQDKHPNGSLLVGSEGKVFIIKNGQRKWIPTPNIFITRYRWQDLIGVSNEYLSTYPDGGNQYYTDGILLADSVGKIYVMNNNTKQHISSPAVFEGYGFNWGQPLRATDSELALIPEGEALKVVKYQRDRVLISPTGSPAVYVVDKTGVLRYIPSPFIFDKLKYRWDQIIKLPPTIFSQYQIGANRLFQDGTVVSYNGVVYLISNDYKKPIGSPNIFLSLGYKWSDIIPLRVNEFNQYPTGNVISDISNDKYNVITVNDGDDMVVNINGKIEEVKLLGIDAPELDSFISPTNYCYGVEAYQIVKNLISSNRISLVKDPVKEDRDDYNRLLRYVYLEDGRSLQEYLLKEGYAKEYTHKGIFYQSQANYKALEQEAKVNKKGLWATSCNPS